MKDYVLTAKCSDGLSERILVTAKSPVRALVTGLNVIQRDWHSEAVEIIEGIFIASTAPKKKIQLKSIPQKEMAK